VTLDLGPKASVSSIGDFDKKYSIVVKCPYSEATFPGILYWLNENCVGAVDIKMIFDTLLVGFEDSDDALIFKIRYSI
jgi:hypothetical protein